jgi:hypothetical protein
VQPQGDARLIQGGIPVGSVQQTAIVHSVDESTRTIAIRAPGSERTSTYRVSSRVSNLSGIKPGDLVQATLAQELTVYVLRDGQAPGPSGTPEMVSADARILTVDPSYRLLTLQFADGRRETVKVPLGVRLGQMEAGGSVVIRGVEVLALRRKG